MITLKEQAFRQGSRDYMRGLTKDNNPFYNGFSKEESDCYLAWIEGWDYAYYGNLLTSK